MILPIYAFAIWLASIESWRDYVAIANNQAIDHMDGWTRRALSMALACAACVWFTLDVMGAVVAGIGAAFLFSAFFRYRLNTLRGLSFDYVSTYNAYDSVFIGLFGANAGRAAYVTEAIIAAAALVVYY